MGVVLSSLYGLFEGLRSQDCPSRILMLGLDAAGKTTVLYKIKLNETVCTIPTIGFNVETVSPVSGITFTVWDVGAQKSIRRLWRHYYVNTSGVFFVIDSTDRERIDEARDELFDVLQDDELTGVPLVVIANKQDLPNAMKPTEVADSLQLHKIRGHKWHIEGACAVNGDGIWEAFESMSTLVKEFKKNKGS